jgi:hypothetical protein
MALSKRATAVVLFFVTGAIWTGFAAIQLNRVGVALLIGVLSGAVVVLGFDRFGRLERGPPGRHHPDRPESRQAPIEALN